MQQSGWSDAMNYRALPDASSQPSAAAAGCKMQK